MSTYNVVNTEARCLTCVTIKQIDLKSLLWVLQISTHFYTKKCKEI